MAAPKETLRWDEVKGPAGRFLFDIYGDRSDLHWGRIVWRSLERRGLADYATPEEKHRVLLRLMTLAVICQEFCYIAWKEGETPPLDDWADEMEMDPMLVAEVAGGTFASQLEMEDEEYNAYVEALKEAVEKTRPEIYRQMVDMFGGKAFLFASLWKIGQSGYPDPEAGKAADEPVKEWDQWRKEDLLANDREYRDTISDVLNEVDPEKMEAFEWVDDGMPAVWW